MAQQYNLGQVAIINKGAYSSAVYYAPLNTVTHRGGTFMCITACSNVEPGVNANWRTYWVPTAIGIYSTQVTAPTETTAKITFTFSDGTTAEHTYNTTAQASGSVTNDSIGETINISKGGTGGTTAAAARSNLGAQAEIIEFQIALGGAGKAWTATKDINGVSLTGRVTANSKVIVAAYPTLANVQNYAKYLVLLSSVGNGTLNFISQDTVPSGTTIGVNVMVAN